VFNCFIVIFTGVTFMTQETMFSLEQIKAGDIKKLAMAKAMLWILIGVAAIGVALVGNSVPKPFDSVAIGIGVVIIFIGESTKKSVRKNIYATILSQDEEINNFLAVNDPAKTLLPTEFLNSGKLNQSASTQKLLGFLRKYKTFANGKNLNLVVELLSFYGEQLNTQRKA